MLLRLLEQAAATARAVVMSMQSSGGRQVLDGQLLKQAAAAAAEVYRSAVGVHTLTSERVVHAARSPQLGDAAVGSYSAAGAAAEKQQPQMPPAAAAKVMSDWCLCVCVGVPARLVFGGRYLTHGLPVFTISIAANVTGGQLPLLQAPLLLLEPLLLLNSSWRVALFAQQHQQDEFVICSPGRLIRSTIDMESSSC